MALLERRTAASPHGLVYRTKGHRTLTESHTKLSSASTTSELTTLPIQKQGTIDRGPFFSLARELRDEIYGYIVIRIKATPKWADLSKKQQTKKDLAAAGRLKKRRAGNQRGRTKVTKSRLLPTNSRPHTSYYVVCKQMREELLCIFYSRNAFDFERLYDIEVHGFGRIQNVIRNVVSHGLRWNWLMPLRKLTIFGEDEPQTHPRFPRIAGPKSQPRFYDSLRPTICLAIEEGSEFSRSTIVIRKTAPRSRDLSSMQSDRVFLRLLSAAEAVMQTAVDQNRVLDGGDLFNTVRLCYKIPDALEDW